MIAKILLIILVFSSLLLFSSEHGHFFQKGFCLFKALSISEYRLAMTIKGITIKKAYIITKWILNARRVSNAGSKLKKQILIPFAC